MIISIVHHYCKPGMLELANLRLDSAGEDMAASPGFVYRYQMVSNDDAQKLTAITAWETLEAMETNAAQRQGAAPAGESPWISIEREAFEVHRTVSPNGA